ncbi:MAG: DUF3147 family protein [Candidatus Krumholzibacteriota bacterium]|nr:DUF3147 family protein [Candidatus Krumholzibacteriota bacterium]
MQTAFKLALSLAVILLCTQIGKRFPSLAGLIATMPLTSLLVLVWLYSDNPDNSRLLENYARGAMWGILPTILFFLVAYWCFRKQFSFTLVLSASFGVWLIGALVHQWFLR